MARLAASVLLLWALFIAPSLCVGGVLVHACDCGTAAECEHEESCPDDPCSFNARPHDHDARVGAELESSPSSVPTLVCEARRDFPPGSGNVPPLPPSHLGQVPYWISDRPLRV